MTIIQQKMDILSYIESPSQKPVSSSNTHSEPTCSVNNENITGCISVSAFCTQLSMQGLNFGRNQMFKWLRTNGYISKQKSTWNMPNKKYILQGYFKLKESFVIIADEQVAKYSPLITQKGKAYLAAKLTESKSLNNSRKAN